MAFQRFLTFSPAQSNSVWSRPRHQTPVEKAGSDRPGRRICCVGFRPTLNTFTLASFRKGILGLDVKSAESGFLGLAALLKRACAADPALCPLHFPCKSAPHSPSLDRSQLPETCSKSAPLINRHETIAGRVNLLSTMGRSGFAGPLPPHTHAAPAQDVHSGLRLQLDSRNAAKL